MWDTVRKRNIIITDINFTNMFYFDMYKNNRIKKTDTSRKSKKYKI